MVMEEMVEGRGMEPHTGVNQIAFAGAPISTEYKYIAQAQALLVIVA